MPRPIHFDIAATDPQKFMLAGVVLTIDVSDLDATLAKVTENGGKVKQPRGPIPGVGWYAAFVDPTGNAFGLMQTDTAAR